MAVKTKLTPSNAYYASTADGTLWVVDNKADAEVLSENACGSVIVSLDNGTSIAEWTASKGIGDWDEASLQVEFSKVKVVRIAFTPFVASSDKTKKFIEALRNGLSALGLYVEVTVIPAGKTLAAIAKGAMSPEYTMSRVTEAIENAVSSAPTALTAKNNEADILFDLAVELFDFHISQDEGAFLTLKKGPKVAYVVQGGTPDLKSFLTTEYLKRYKSIAPKSMVTDAMNSIESYCKETSEFKTLSYRNGQSTITGINWVDLGRKDGKMVGINHEGWWISDEPDADVFFRRSSSLLELPLPEKSTPQEAYVALQKHYRPVFNINDEEFNMVLAWMITHTISSWNAPVAMFLGESGCGKTSATTAISAVLESIVKSGAIMPEKADDIAVTVASKSISLWNNVSFISKAQSDNICQYIDGSVYEKRKLHSNKDVVELDLNPSILLNGIAFGAINSDLKTRSIVFNLEPMKPSEDGRKMSLKEVTQSVVDCHPIVLGAVFTLTAQVLNEVPMIAIPHDGPRMPDYAKAVMAIDKLWNLEGATYKQYMASLNSMSSESLDDPIFTVLHNLIVSPVNFNPETGCYSKMLTNKELMKAFANPYITNKDGSMERLYGTEGIEFKNANEMTGTIKRAVTDWKRFGVTFVNHRDIMVNGVRGTYKEFTFDPAKSNSMWKSAQVVRF